MKQTITKLSHAVREANEYNPLPLCRHDNALRDAAYEMLEPLCGCRLAAAPAEVGGLMSKALSISFTVNLVVENAIEADALREEYNNDPLEFIKYLTTEEGLLGCANDEYEITAAAVVP